MRYLAIDLGDKRTGLAVGDDQTGIVTPLDVVEVSIKDRGGDALLEALLAAIDSQFESVRAKPSPAFPGGKGPTAALVVGLPLNMDDTEGPRAKLVRAFAARIGQKTGLPIHFQDERLTSAEADWSMARSGMTHKQKKERRDALAAAAILKDFLSARGPANTGESTDQT